MSGKWSMRHGKNQDQERVKNKMKYIILLIFFLSTIFILFAYAYRNRDSDLFLKPLMSGVSYEILDQKVGPEGLMGNLNRSWVIKLHNPYNESNFYWNSWLQAKPHFENQEMIDSLAKRHSKFLNFNKENKAIVVQRIVPEGLLNTMRSVTVRVCILDKEHIFLLIESD